mgnify:CR=1 FL=1
MIKELFDSGWEYTESARVLGLQLGEWQPINLPHDASIGKPRSPQHPSGPGGGYAWSGSVSYRKRFPLRVAPDGRRAKRRAGRGDSPHGHSPRAWHSANHYRRQGR